MCVLSEFKTGQNDKGSPRGHKLDENRVLSVRGREVQIKSCTFSVRRHFVRVPNCTLTSCLNYYSRGRTFLLTASGRREPEEDVADKREARACLANCTFLALDLMQRLETACYIPLEQPLTSDSLWRHVG